MLKLVLVALLKYKINCLKGWTIKTYYSGHHNVCNIYFCCRLCSASFWHVDIANFGNIYIFYPKLELVQDNETGQEKLGPGARGAEKKTEFDENWFLCEYATDETTYGTCNNVAQRMELKQRALRDGSFYLWEQSWAQFESGTMRGSRCPTFHFIEVWFRSSFHISYHWIFSTFF